MGDLVLIYFFSFFSFFVEGEENPEPCIEPSSCHKILGIRIYSEGGIGGGVPPFNCFITAWGLLPLGMSFCSHANQNLGHFVAFIPCIKCIVEKCIIRFSLVSLEFISFSLSPSLDHNPPSKLLSYPNKSLFKISFNIYFPLSSIYIWEAKSRL